MQAIQTNRKIQVFTALPDNTLLFYKMHGSEQLSDLFVYQLELVSEKATINPESVLGETLTVQLELDNSKFRFFQGFVTRFGYYSHQGAYHHYRAEVKPWLWFLTRASNCRIFQNQTAPDIIKQVFRDQGFSDFESKLTGNYRTREYCVQYRETDFNFVSRLMEEDGIYYYFTHSNGKHTLILADANNSHEAFPGYETIPFHVDRRNTRTGTSHIFSWGFAREVQPGTYELNDYDFKKPKANLLAKSQLAESHANSSYEFFDYPGHYIEPGDGDNYARQRIEELHTRFERHEGETIARGIATGYLFSLQDSPRKDQNKKYLVVSADYHLALDDYFSDTVTTASEELFQATFTAHDHARPFRPPVKTSKPLVHGAQTAVVVGPAGDEIYTDQYGRVKVQFHWDRYGKKDQDSSCWVRVSHPWAGKNWGMVAIPRIGHEVVIEFLEGDPDQPLIVGSVYNADMMPPYALPANATQTGILTRSSKGGSAATANELRFEDKKGSEQVYLHAEKNQDIEVENDETHWVGHDRTKTIDNDETTHVKHDRTETVDNNETITIGVNRTETVGSNETISIGSNRTESVGANETITIALTRNRAVGVNEAIAIGAAQEIAVGAARSLTVGANQATSIGNSHSVSVGNDQSTSVGKNQSSSVGENRSASVGKDDSLKVGKNLVIDAGDSITIKTGDASITMKKNGDITIKGKNISIRGSGKINVKADSDVVIKGSKIGEN